MLAFLSFLVGVGVGIFIASGLFAWILANYVIDYVNKLEDEANTVASALEKLEDALADGYISVNNVSKD